MQISTATLQARESHDLDFETARESHDLFDVEAQQARTKTLTAQSSMKRVRIGTDVSTECTHTDASTPRKVRDAQQPPTSSTKTLTTSRVSADGISYLADSTEVEGASSSSCSASKRARTSLTPTSTPSVFTSSARNANENFVQNMSVVGNTFGDDHIVDLVLRLLQRKGERVAQVIEQRVRSGQGAFLLKRDHFIEASVLAEALKQWRSRNSLDIPSGWEEAVDPESGCTYYFHRTSGARVWEKPTEAAAGAIAAKNDKHAGGTDWETYHTEQGRPYLFHRGRNEVCWNLPPGVRSVSPRRQTVSLTSDASNAGTDGMHHVAEASARGATVGEDVKLRLSYDDWKRSSKLVECGGARGATVGENVKLRLSYDDWKRSSKLVECGFARDVMSAAQALQDAKGDANLAVEMLLCSR